MLFRKFYTLKSSKTERELKDNFLSQELKIHDIPFEIHSDKEVIKIVPNTEDNGHVYTLPVVYLKFVDSGKGMNIKMSVRPRRIDIGGPYLLMIFITFAIFTGALLLWKGEAEYHNTAYILIGIAGVFFMLLFMRLHQGYYDYIKKIKAWVKSNS